MHSNLNYDSIQQEPDIQLDCDKNSSVYVFDALGMTKLFTSNHHIPGMQVQDMVIVEELPAS